MLTGVQMVLCLALLTQSGDVSLSSRLDQLNSPDYATRHIASQMLMQAHEITTQQLDALYQQTTSAEQKNRLEQIALHQCLRQWIEKQKQGKTPVPGSIGIRMLSIKPQTHPSCELPGIWVEATLPGFPAHEYLLHGDLIVAINGTEFGSFPADQDLTISFRTLIQQQASGTPINFKIIRDNQALTVTFPTAPATALKALYNNETRLDARPLNQFSPLAFKLWQSRLASLTGQTSSLPNTPVKPENEIPIQWQANAVQ